jgi:hypothetical protein
VAQPGEAERIVFEATDAIGPATLLVLRCRVLQESSVLERNAATGDRAEITHHRTGRASPSPRKWKLGCGCMRNPWWEMFQA